MAKSSINFAKASGGGFSHNDRTQKNEADYLLPIEHRLENEYDFSAKEATQKIQNLYSEAKDNYQNKFKQKLQAKSYTWEAVINLNKEHTLQDVQQLTKAIEKETGFTSVQIAVHRDEGHINERGVVQHNLHAHVTFFTLDQKTGQQLYRKSITPKQAENQPKLKPMNRARLSELQTLTAKELGMERGIVSVKEEAKRIMSKVQKRERPSMPHKQYRQHAKEQSKELAKQKDLKAEIAELRANLKAVGANREQYAVLEGLNRELKAEIKAKNLTTKGLENKLEEYLNKHIEKNKQINVLEAKISDLNALGESESSKDLLKQNIEDLDNSVDILLEFDMPLPKATNLLNDSWLDVDGQKMIDISKTKAFIGDKIDEKHLAENINALLSQAKKLKKERDTFQKYSKELKSNLEKIKAFMQRTKNKFEIVKGLFFKNEKNVEIQKEKISVQKNKIEKKEKNIGFGR